MHSIVQFEGESILNHGSAVIPFSNILPQAQMQIGKHSTDIGWFSPKLA
jgi:hypothetical protein